ncbi:MAG: hypothetical protein ABI855_20810 [Bacteroidota bacterium]
MKKSISSILLAFSLGITLISSCKKKEEEQKLDTETQQFNTDANNYKSESDQADNDINNSLNSYPSFGRVAGVVSSPLCGATVDTSQLSQKILIFNFDGVTPCFSPSRTRSGQIKVQLTSGAFWHDAGSVLTETFINFKVTRLSDNKSVMFNGVKTLKNMNGNNWIGFLLGTSTLKYQERAFNIHVTFDNATATWNTAHITEWSYTPSASSPYSDKEAFITFTAIGDTTLNGFNNVSAWGVNRFGQNFTTYYNSSILSNTYCGLWRPNQGELVHNVNNSDFTLSLGVDQSGNPTPYACAYGYKVAWTSNGNTGSVILSY